MKSVTKKKHNVMVLYELFYSGMHRCDHRNCNEPSFLQSRVTFIISGSYVYTLKTFLCVSHLNQISSILGRISFSEKSKTVDQTKPLVIDEYALEEMLKRSDEIITIPVYYYPGSRTCDFISCNEDGFWGMKTIIKLKKKEIGIFQISICRSCFYKSLDILNKQLKKPDKNFHNYDIVPFLRLKYYQCF